MKTQHGSRFVPITVGIIELVIGFFIAGRGSGIIYYLTALIGGGLFLLGLYSLYLGIFGKQEKVDKMTLGNYNKKEEKTSKDKEKQSNYNKLSIIGFVLSIISIFGVGLAGLIGFILGIVALTQIKHTHEKGKGLAIAAIIIGFIWGFVVGILKRLVEAGF